jgi:hypothetical protein
MVTRTNLWTAGGTHTEGVTPEVERLKGAQTSSELMRYDPERRGGGTIGLRARVIVGRSWRFGRSGSSADGTNVNDQPWKGNEEPLRVVEEGSGGGGGRAYPRGCVNSEMSISTAVADAMAARPGRETVHIWSSVRSLRDCREE